MKRFVIYFLTYFLICFCLLVFVNLGFSQESLKKVLILPFEIHAQQDLLYLRSAIPEMLTSRIFVPSKIEVIEPEKVSVLLKEIKTLDRRKIEELGYSLKADYVIWGSLTVVGDTVSLDAQIMDLSKAKKPVQFYQEIKSLSEVIPQLSRFAKKTKSYIEGKEEDFYKEEPLPFSSAFSLSRTHPERNLYFGGKGPYLESGTYGTLPAQEQKSKVTRAKPRFSYDEDESLTKNLVIDLSKPQPVIGWAEEKPSTNASSTPITNSIYSPTYNYPYPIYYYPQTEEKSFLERVWGFIWPFKREKSENLPSPQLIQPIKPVQPMPVPSQTVSSYSQNPQTIPVTTPPVTTPVIQPQPQSQTLGENPWQWN